MKLVHSKYKLIMSIILFCLIYYITIALKPSFLFTEDNVPRQFGIGFENKTILPIWMYVILLAIACYMAMLFSTHYITVEFH